jgi:hypothetical protein
MVTQHRENLSVFTGLGHDAVVSRDHHQHRIDTLNTRDHVANESLMARHIHKRPQAGRRIRFSFPGRLIRCRPVRKPQLDRNASTLFFGKPVSAMPRNRLDQRCFTVVYVPGGRDDHD